MRIFTKSASCVRKCGFFFVIGFSIANSSNQKNSLSTDFQTSSLVLCTVYFLIYFIPRFVNGSVRIGLKATKTMPS